MQAIRHHLPALWPHSRQSMIAAAGSECAASRRAEAAAPVHRVCQLQLADDGVCCRRLGRVERHKHLRRCWGQVLQAVEPVADSDSGLVRGASAALQVQINIIRSFNDTRQQLCGCMCAGRLLICHKHRSACASHNKPASALQDNCRHYLHNQLAAIPGFAVQGPKSS
jgi:hypothetical protein